MNEEHEGKHGVQSLEVGVRVLQAILNGHRAMMLKEIAAASGMPASKVHRYLVSMVRAGLVEQDPGTSRYDLGPLSLNLGLVALDRLDRIRLGLSAIAELCGEINETTALAVWSENGPIIIRWEKPRRPITVNVVTGTALDMITSASGRIFGAYLPPQTYEHLVAKELAQGNLPVELNSLERVHVIFEQTRQSGIATVSGYHLVPGVAAVGAPVFNLKGEITLALLVVGVQGMFDTRIEGNVVKALKVAAQRLSWRLGYTPDGALASPTAATETGTRAANAHMSS